MIDKIVTLRIHYLENSIWSCDMNSLKKPRWGGGHRFVTARKDNKYLKRGLAGCLRSTEINLSNWVEKE